MVPASEPPTTAIFSVFVVRSSVFGKRRRMPAMVDDFHGEGCDAECRAQQADEQPAALPPVAPACICCVFSIALLHPIVI